MSSSWFWKVFTSYVFERSSILGDENCQSSFSKRRYKFFSLTHMGRGDVKETFPLLATLAIFSDDVEFRNSNARVLQKK